MEDLLHRLEKQIRDLIDQHEQLRFNNQQLYHGKFHLVREKELLLSKQQKAALQIEGLIAKLKEIDKIS